MIRITSYTNFRTNFALDNLHYSLTEVDEFNSYACIRCKEIGQCWSLGFDDYENIIDHFIMSRKHGATYTQRYNLNALEKFAREIITGVSFYKTEYYTRLAEMRRQKQIAYHLSCLKNFGYEIGGDK